MAGPFSKEQQQTLFQIAKGAKGPDVPFEDEAGKFMEESLTPEEQKQVPEFEGQPEGLIKEKGKYDPKKHEADLRKHRYINMANDLADTRMGLDATATKLKDDNQMLTLKTMRTGIQMMQAGAVDMGTQMVNAVIPEGQRILKVTQLKGNKVRAFTENNPDGEVIDVDELIRSITSAETQFKEMAADRRKAADRAVNKQLKANEYRRRDGSITNQSAIEHDYRSAYDLMDDLDLRIMKKQNPDQWWIEKRKKETAPSLYQFAQWSQGIDLRGTQGMEKPERVKTSQIIAEKAKGFPKEVYMLDPGEEITHKGAIYRRDPRTMRIQRRLAGTKR